VWRTGEGNVDVFCEDAVRVGFDGVGGTGALLIDPRKYEGQRMDLKQQLQLIGSARLGLGRLIRD